MPEARATDPITSKLAAVRVNNASCDRYILDYLSEEGSANTYVIATMIDRKETTVSSALSRLRRENLVHEAGMDESAETGCQRILWAYGPTPDPQPGTKMPVRQTGPRKQQAVPSIDMFMPDEVRAALASFNNVPDFTTWLNNQMMERVRF